MGFLIDTCIWIDVERGKISAADVAHHTGEEEVFLSPVTIAELQFGVEIAINPAVQQARQKSVDLLKNKPILKIDEETGAVYGRLAALLRKQGRTADYRVMDLWLASQALQFNMKFLTKNLKDFADIPGLQLTPWNM